MFLTLVFLNLFNTSHASKTCPQDRVYNYRGIDCCLDVSFTQSHCHSAVDSLPANLVSMFFKVRTEILNGVYVKDRYPNCFRASASYFLEETLQNPSYFRMHEIKDLINEHFEEVDSLSVGILVMLRNVDLMLVDPSFNLYSTTLIPFHSTVYLGDGLAIQKENHTDEVFSIVRLNDAVEAYNRVGMGQFGEPLTVKYYRLKQQ